MFKTATIRQLTAASLAVILASCAQAPQDPSNANNRPNIGALSIHSSSPSHGESQVCLDHVFKLIFDDKVDAYSAIPDNFEVWTIHGDRVGGDKLVSTKFVEHPDIPGRIVSEIKVSLVDTYLTPQQEYYFMWGEANASNPDIDPNAFGIQNLLGYATESGAVRFTTANCFNDINSQAFDVVSMNPGRILTRGKVFDIGNDLSNLLNGNRNNSFVTFQENANIRITFNQSLSRIPGVDPASGPLGEVPSTPIQDFPYLSVIVLDATTQFEQLFASVISLDVQGWQDFRTTYSNRLNGRVYSTNGRRTLVFELNDGDSYPDSLAQAVFVIGRGFEAEIGNADDIKLRDDLLIGGFMHFSGFSSSSPIQFVYDLFTPEEGS